MKLTRELARTRCPGSGARTFQATYTHPSDPDAPESEGIPSEGICPECDQPVLCTEDGDLVEHFLWG